MWSFKVILVDENNRESTVAGFGSVDNTLIMNFKAAVKKRFKIPVDDQTAQFEKNGKKYDMDLSNGYKSLGDLGLKKDMTLYIGGKK